MSAAEKFINILSCANGSDLDREISGLSESDARQFLKSMIQFVHGQGIDINDLVQFSQEHIFP